jgi:hypothetical protein
MPETGTCSVCGCTENDACLGGCIWANASATLCSRCVDSRSVIEQPTRSIWDGCETEVQLDELFFSKGTFLRAWAEGRAGDWVDVTVKRT